MRVKGWMLAGAVLSTAWLAGCQSAVDPMAETERAKLNTAVLQYEQQLNEMRLSVENANRRASLVEIDNKKLQTQLALSQQANQSLRAAGQVSPNRLSDKVQQQLQALAARFGANLVGNRLELPGDFFFDSGSYTVNPVAKQALAQISQILRGENLTLLIVGHTDNDPVRNPNLRSKNITDNRMLSMVRAKSVLDELKRAGYPDQLMYATGWGELLPIAPNATKEQKRLNRRVDILIDPGASNIFGMSSVQGITPLP